MTAALELIGYPDRLSARRGETLDFMVSTDAARVEAAIVRLLHGDEHPDGPGFKEQEVERLGDFAGAKQVAVAGSYAFAPLAGLDATAGLTAAAWIWPTLPARAGRQVVLAVPGLLELAIEDGRLVARTGPDGAALALDGLAPRPRRWCFVALALSADGAARLWAREQDAPLVPVRADRAEAAAGSFEPPAAPLRFAVAADVAEDRPPRAHFNGRVEQPSLYAGALDWARIEALAAAAGPDDLPRAGLALCWDLAREQQSSRAVDVSGHGRDGALVNGPARAVTGRRWNGETMSWRHAPEQYAAVHFHEDDLDDARWEASLSWTVPAELPSGVYAARLRAEGREDRVPFVVRPDLGAPDARAAVLLPTLTYLAYANERMIDSPFLEELVDAGLAVEPSAADDYLAAHPEVGRSLYDCHVDGSGCMYSSRRRPIPNMRADHRMWTIGAPERFAADLYLIDWLTHERIPFDVITDEDLHADGVALLDAYDVVMTGEHPEYWTTPMRDALEAYLDRAGQLMYLGGNGFYWVTSIDPERPHVIEVRRGFNGSRAWTSDPGEAFHSTTGEPGGLWRYRGRAPNRLVGVGFGAQGDLRTGAAGYARLPDSFDPRAAFIFEGVGADELIGEFGLVNGGAAGYEIDRCDADLGTPPETLRLATSAGRHDDTYYYVVEDLLGTDGSSAGLGNPRVGADLAYVEHPSGGRVFSASSCNWLGSLSHAGYDNNVARITGNVLRGFLARGRRATPSAA
jgi:N,N-dimethylformamidase